MPDSNGSIPVRLDSTSPLVGALDVETLSAGMRHALSEEWTTRVTSLLSGRQNWDDVAGEIAAELGETISNPVSDVLVKAWTESGAFTKLWDPDSFDADAVTLLALKEHSIEYSTSPSVEILLNDQPLVELSLVVHLLLTIEGFILRIQNACIQSIKTGTCVGQAQVSATLAGREFVLVDQKSKPIDLPGDIRLNPPVPLFPSLRQRATGAQPEEASALPPVRGADVSIKRWMPLLQLG